MTWNPHLQSSKWKNIFIIYIYIEWISSISLHGCHPSTLLINHGPYWRQNWRVAQVGKIAETICLEKLNKLLSLISKVGIWETMKAIILKWNATFAVLHRIWWTICTLKFLCVISAILMHLDDGSNRLILLSPLVLGCLAKSINHHFLHNYFFQSESSCSF